MNHASGASDPESEDLVDDRTGAEPPGGAVCVGAEAEPELLQDDTIATRPRAASTPRNAVALWRRSPLGQCLMVRLESESR